MFLYCYLYHASEAALLVDGKGAYCVVIVHTVSYLPYSGIMMFLWSSFVFTLMLRSVSVSFYGTKNLMKQNFKQFLNISTGL